MIYLLTKELHETKYEDYYVTVDGEVYSWFGNKPVKRLKYCYKGQGYCYVIIEGKHIYIHRLMAETFLGLDITNSKLEVNHLDGDPTNNALYNLQICDRKENVRHGQRLKKMRKGCAWLYMCNAGLEKI